MIDFATYGASESFALELVVYVIHVYFQHGSAHEFLLTDSAFDKLLNTFNVIILPVVIYPIFASPCLGLVSTVRVSTGKPD